MHDYTYTDARRYIHWCTSIHTLMHDYTYTDARLCTDARLNIHWCTTIHTLMHDYTSTRAHTLCLLGCTASAGQALQHTHTHTHTHIYIYANTYKHTHKTLPARLHCISWPSPPTVRGRPPYRVGTVAWIARRRQPRTQWLQCRLQLPVCKEGWPQRFRSTRTCKSRCVCSVCCVSFRLQVCVFCMLCHLGCRCLCVLYVVSFRLQVSVCSVCCVSFRLQVCVFCMLCHLGCMCVCSVCCVI